MKKFKYLTVDLEPEKWYGSDFLNSYGKDGWELVQMDNYRAIFKREIL